MADSTAKKPMITLESLKQSVKKPPRICIYGDAGIGKTTFAAQAPSPIIIQTEDGLGDLDTPAFPLSHSFDEVIANLAWLATEKHDFKTLCLDSLDWLETLIWNAVCAKMKVESISDIPYGDGYNQAMIFWEKFFKALTYLRDENNMIIILTAHDSIKPITDPLQPSYDAHGIKLHKKASAKIEEFCDVILFATWQVTVSKEEKGFGNTRNRAVSTGDRVMYCDGAPSYVAKNRYKLPKLLPLSWDEFNNAYQNRGK